MSKPPEAQYFHSWPKYKNNKIEIKVLTPLRMLIVQKLIYYPVIFLFRWSFIFLIFEGLLRVLKGNTFFIWLPHLSFKMIFSYIGVVGLLMLIEIATRFKLTRMLLGVRLKIQFNQKEIKVRMGTFKKSFSRSVPVSFAIKGFETGNNPLYSKSKKFQLVVDDHHSITLAEIFDLKLTDKLVENCNYANLQTSKKQDVDVDPRTLARA